MEVSLGYSDAVHPHCPERYAWSNYREREPINFIVQRHLYCSKTPIPLFCDLSKNVAGQDVIGLAQTGSGKTGAFSLPILQDLLDNPQHFFALVLSPTRELAIQIAEQVEALGSGVGVRTAVLVGGIDMMSQAIQLAKRPHVIVGTPGRVVDHLTNTKGFSLKALKHLVLDEADRLLNMDFEKEIDTVVKAIPRVWKELNSDELACVSCSD